MKSPQAKYRLGKIANLLILAISAPLDIFIGYSMATRGILSATVIIAFTVSLLLSVAYYLIEWFMLEHLTKK